MNQTPVIRCRGYHAWMLTTFCLCLMLTGAFTSAFTPLALHAQTAAVTPSAEGPETTLGESLPAGVSFELITSGSAAVPDSIGESHLALQRIVLEEDNELTPQTTGSGDVLMPDLLVIEQGTVTLRDEIGLVTTLTAGDSLSIAGGSSYTLRNNGEDDVTILRLGAFSTSEQTSSDADAEGTEVLASGPLAGSLGKPLLNQFTLFLGRATFQPGTSIPGFTHDGPFGLYIEEGSLNITGPSGIEGTVSSGSGVVIPAKQPHAEHNASDAPVTALIFGFLPEEAALYPVESIDSGDVSSESLADQIVGSWALYYGYGELAHTFVFTADGRFMYRDTVGLTHYGQYAVTDDNDLQLISSDLMNTYTFELRDDWLSISELNVSLFRVVDGVSTQSETHSPREYIVTTWIGAHDTLTFYPDGTVTILTHSSGDTTLGTYRFLDDFTLMLNIGEQDVVAGAVVVSAPNVPYQLRLTINGTTINFSFKTQ